jgi:FkbM family methyltransferase
MHNKICIKNQVLFYCLFFISCKSNDRSYITYNLISGLPDIHIIPETEKIGHTWSQGIVWDKKLIELFYQLLPANKPFVVIDFGAQTGSFSLLAKFFSNSHWYAFEPIAEAADILKQNIALNSITNVTVQQKAGSDKIGTAILSMPAINNWGLSTLGSQVLRFETVHKREISCIDLDSFVVAEKINKIDFIKIDTEGSELSILRGAYKTIIRDRPIILMEYNETNLQQCGASKLQINAYLEKLNYSWKLVSSEDILCLPKEIIPVDK